MWVGTFRQAQHRAVYEEICTADFRGQSQPIDVADVNLYEMARQLSTGWPQCLQSRAKLNPLTSIHGSQQTLDREEMQAVSLTLLTWPDLI